MHSVKSKAESRANDKTKTENIALCFKLATDGSFRRRGEDVASKQGPFQSVISSKSIKVEAVCKCDFHNKASTIEMTASIIAFLNDNPRYGSEQEGCLSRRLSVPRSGRLVSLISRPTNSKKKGASPPREDNRPGTASSNT